MGPSFLTLGLCRVCLIVPARVIFPLSCHRHHHGLSDSVHPIVSLTQLFLATRQCPFLVAWCPCVSSLSSPFLCYSSTASLSRPSLVPLLDMEPRCAVLVEALVVRMGEGCGVGWSCCRLSPCYRCSPYSGGVTVVRGGCWWRVGHWVCHFAHCSLFVNSWIPRLMKYKLINKRKNENDMEKTWGPTEDRCHWSRMTVSGGRW